jgi:hypothetical protein
MDDNSADYDDAYGDEVQLGRHNLTDLLPVHLNVDVVTLSSDATIPGYGVHRTRNGCGSTRDSIAHRQEAQTE